MIICAIHQPNFFPWAGYFDKIRLADIFIFLDEVIYPKSGSGSGSWCNRVKLLSAGHPAWYGLPIKRQPGEQLIKNVYFSNKEYHILKLKKMLHHNYNKTAFYQPIMEKIEHLIDFESHSLTKYNINAIRELSDLLGLKAKFVKQSELRHSKHSTELLIELVKAVGADAYLCGNGAGGYQNDDLFVEHNIRLIYQNFDPTKNNFFKITNEQHFGLSILNWLFHKGFNG